VEVEEEWRKEVGLWRVCCPSVACLVLERDIAPRLTTQRISTGVPAGISRR
jgi:hypothetical protein